MDASIVTAPAPGIQTSSTLGKLAGALAKAQSSFKAVVRSREVEVTSKRTGARYKFTYAPLDTVLDAAIPSLAANGLSLTQELSGTDAGRFCTTTLMHESGEWRSSTLQLPGEAPTSAQEFGSQVTYARRYALQCVLGVAAEEDDDANGADGNEVGAKKTRAAKPAPAPAPAAPRLEAKTQARIKILQNECSIEDREWREKLMYHYGVESSADLTTDQALDLIRRLGDVKRTKGPVPAQLTTDNSKSDGQG